MRDKPPALLEAGRIRSGEIASPRGLMCGTFRLRGPKHLLHVISSGFAVTEVSAGWEHVSVSAQHACPSWADMCWVKNLFWSEEELVVQFHPPRSEYVNNHPNCLHLWSRADGSIPLPPSILVGLKERP